MNEKPKVIQEFPADLWQRDEPLRRAAELIEQSAGGIRAVSFDFFDTIVWRMVGKPTDVFCEVGHRLIEAELLRPPFTPGDYELLRRHAEGKTRGIQNARDHKVEDISIRDIYTQLKPVVADGASALPIEHDAERDLCIVNPIMVGFLHYLHQKGLRLLITSDIYFQADHLRTILRANGLDPAIFEFVLTSADEGLCKGTGNLFKRALKLLKLEAGQILHIGDNFHPDVIGARRAGVRGCHYTLAPQRSFTIIDRERFLLGGQTPVFSANWLRLLAARLFHGESDEAFFGQMGALLLGPVLTRFATWACDQFVASGIRKVGALMREGELFGQLLQKDADARGLDLEITPLYVNRKSTDLAAIGRLTADNVIEWLDARQTLPIRTILEHFGLSGEVVRHVPFALDEKADKPEKILTLAKFLFTPEIAERIEAKSTQERRKVLDYLKPWLEGGKVFGVCDIGYSASAQTQLTRILALDENPTHVVGCYLITYERAADRVLDGIDIRHYLGAYGHPHYQYLSFLRSPAFMEQSITAACGTTLGYERLDDGTVKPILDKMPYDEKMLRRQKAFKTGVLEFQRLWLWTSRLRPGLIDGSTEFSRRVLADVDCGIKPILARATSFPTTSEVTHFGSLALDDCYFADAYKPLCGDKDRENLRKNGYASLHKERGVHWPHGVFHMENPGTAAEFFSLGKAMLCCDTNGDGDRPAPELTILLSAGRDPAALRECLSRLKTGARSDLRYEVFVLVAKDDEGILAVTKAFSREIPRFRVIERTTKQSAVEMINLGADNSGAPFLMLLDEGARLAPGWDAPLLKLIRGASDIGVLLPNINRRGVAGQDALATTLRGFVVRRSAFVEALGMNEELTPTGAMWHLLLCLRELNWKIEFCQDLTVEVQFAETAASLFSFDKACLTKRCAEFSQFAEDLVARKGTTAPTVGGSVRVNWIGSFLDHGSLSHVNRELARALSVSKEIKLQRVSNGAPAAPAFKDLAREVATSAADAAVTVRHAWPPDWQRPKQGALVVIQPWEFGSLPKDWVEGARQVDEFWLPSEYVRRVYADSGVPAEKLVVVPNGVDTKQFNPQATPMRLGTRKKFKFLFVGGTILRKGPDVLLKAYLENFTSADDVSLIIKDFGGQSVYAGQTFEQQIRAAQARPDAPEIIYLNQELSPEYLPGLYTACDCLVLPYRGEGFGLPVLEAMACGLPVMVTAGGATDDFVRDDFAWRVPATRQVFGDSVSGMKLAGAGWMLEPSLAALGEAMRNAFLNPAETRARGQRASQHAQKFCSWERSAEIASQRIRDLAARNVKGAPQPAAAKKAAAITLPACALLGHLAEARELLSQKKSRAAWESTMAAIAKRPFHPEAYLQLAAIAQGVGDSQSARTCAEYAKQIAPGWKPAKQFLKQHLKGNTRPEWLTLPAMNAKRLSVCLIVKNEEKFLGQCLKSVMGLATQIVVLDTGSTDRTVEIAKEHGAEVHTFEWCDDFSAARNAMLEHVTGDWVLGLDADEELSADAHAQLQQAMSDRTAMAWRLPIVDVGREAEGCSYVPRLFRNAPALFYVGRVHEQVFSSIEVRRAEWGLENKIGEAKLIHHGYTAEVTRDRNKVERNLRLLEQAIEEFPGEPHLLMNLGLELARSGREAEALARYREAFEILSGKPAAEIVPELRETLLTQLCARLTTAKRFDEIVRVLTAPLARPALTASLHFSLGLAHLELKQFSEAADQMRQCLAKSNQRSLAPINKDILTAAPHHCLALALARSGDAAGADKAFQAGLSATGHADTIRIDYAKFLAEHNRPVEALELLNGMVAQNAGNSTAWQLGGQIALSRPEFLEFARDWTNEAIRNVSTDVKIISQRAEALMLSGDTAGALGLWEQVGVAAPRPAALAGLILCETVESESTHAPADERDEQFVSRAFLEWYQKLVAANARATLARLNDCPEKLARVLPTAARILQSAMAEAAQPEATLA